MALALILGWWLVAGSGAQPLPRPSLSLHPSHGVSLGDAVTLRCHLPPVQAWVWLYKEGRWTPSKYKDKEQDAVEFSLLSTSWEHAGPYRCQYRLYWTAETSELSDPVELVLTDRSFPPPSISLSPGKRVGTGSNVSIQCRNEGYGGAFLLHKDGCSAPIRRQELLVPGTATFALFGVTPADSGTYRCSYRPWAQRFLSSALGNNVTLEVAPTPAPPAAADRSHGSPVLALVGGGSAAFILALVVSFLLAARGRRMRRDESPGAPAEKPEDAEFQAASSSDSEGLTYMELQAVTPGAQPPNPPADPQPPVIYAEVAAGRRR